MPTDYAVHSDLLVHWTGKDIDREFQPNWSEEDHMAIGTDAVQAYLLRLRNILKYGLWMTEQQEWITQQGTVVPSADCVCFTELKLSESLIHARKYGRLGIAVKRPFVFRRTGRPVVYYEPKFGSDALLSATEACLENKRLLHYFKPMNEDVKGRLEYSYYAESEWKIVMPNHTDSVPKIVNPRSTKAGDVADYFNSLQAAERERLRFLVPLDGWLATIVYPALKVKNLAQRDGSEIQQLIRKIATEEGHAKRVEGVNLPIELDLGICKHL